MTFSIITMATPEQAEAIRASILGAGKARKAPKPKAFRRGPMLVEQLTSWATDGSFVELQIPLVVEALHAHGGAQWKAKREKKLLRPIFISALRGLNERISGIHFTRIYSERGKPMDDDNLPGAFKSVRDELCRFIRHGPVITKEKGIGSHDDWVKQQWKGTGKTWPPTLSETTHETDKRLQGIRIRLQLQSPQGSSPAT